MPEIQYVGPLESTPNKIEYVGSLSDIDRAKSVAGSSLNNNFATFPFDRAINDAIKDVHPEQREQQRGHLAQFFVDVARPWKATYYETLSSASRGAYDAYQNFDNLATFISDITGMSKGDIWEKGAKASEFYADKYARLAQENGIMFAEELFGDILGGTIPGIVNFMLEVRSGYALSFIRGYQGSKNAGENGKDPFINGLIEAAKTGTLSKILKMVQPFNKWVQSTTLGTLFGSEAALSAPEGDKLREAGKGFGMGLAFGAMGQGDIRYRDLYRDTPTMWVVNERINSARPEPKPTAKATDTAKEGTVAKGPFEGLQKTLEFREIPDPDIGFLTQRLRELPPETNLKDRIKLADAEAKIGRGSLASIQTAFNKMKAYTEVAKQWYKAPPKADNFTVLFDEYIGLRDIYGIKTQQYAEEINKKFSPQTQEAITKWIRAGGDIAELQKRAAESSDPITKRKYTEAQSLSPDAIEFAKAEKAYYERMLDRAVEAGILEHGVDNYVNRIYKLNPKQIKLGATLFEQSSPNAGNTIRSEINSGLFIKNPQFAKKRIYKFDWEAEKEGAILEDRIGYLTTIYQQSFEEAIAARQFVKKISEHTAEDGRPLVVPRGGGYPIPKGADAPEAYLIKPKTPPKPKEVEYKAETGEQYPSEVTFGDYKEINHPAFRKWKWVGSDVDGRPIFLESDLLIHPSGYKKINNYLKKSEVPGVIDIWGFKPIEMVQKFQSQFKATLLSLSGFHQTHIGQHALTHGISPFYAEPIDVNRKLDYDLITHELKVYEANPAVEFMEGLRGAGLTAKIPVIGEYAQKYTEYLFKGPNGYIPRLKMKLAKELYARNIKRYRGELTNDQILILSSRQANAAFGGLNYAAMGRSKTIQDLFRLGALAPDFLEARFRFAGQAAKPYGWEQLSALAIRGAIGMYVGSKIVEMIASLVDPEENKVHWDRPFSVSMYGYEFSIRSVQGDLVHLFHDPRNFLYHRLNPAVSRFGVEIVTGVDSWGNKRNISEALKDYMVSAVPIPAQGIFTKDDYALWQTILQSAGIPSWEYRTDAEKEILNIYKTKGRDIVEGATKERRDIRNELEDDYRENADIKPILEARDAKKITNDDVTRIVSRATQPEISLSVSALTPPEVVRVWKKANDKERVFIYPIMVKKYYDWDAIEAEKEPIKNDIEEVQKWIKEFGITRLQTEYYKNVQELRER